MTSSFGPDAEHGWVNWFKLLHMPTSLLDIGHQKSSQNLHEIPIPHRLWGHRQGSECDPGL